jgi:NAD(P)-dependent dehydrogenase (short-subunit alcohol dehydrogenase family)
LPAPKWMKTVMTDRPVILVTGASRGIGSAVARWLAAIGCNLALVARSVAHLNASAAEIGQLGGTALVLPGDIAASDFCAHAVAETQARFGRLDALINNAGIFEPVASTADADPAAWQRTLAVNLLGPFYLSRAALPALRRRRGRIVNVSSGAATLALPAAGAYCVSKAGLNHFTRVLAAEEPAVTAVAVRPGVVDTDMQALIRRLGPAAMPAEQAAYYRRLKTEGRLEPPAIPARSIAWLALRAPSAWSGKFLDYDAPELGRPALDFFGENPAGQTPKRTS